MIEWYLIYIIAHHWTWGELKRLDGFKTYESCEATKEMILKTWPHSKVACVAAGGAAPYWGAGEKR